MKSQKKTNTAKMNRGFIFHLRPCLRSWIVSMSMGLLILCSCVGMAATEGVDEGFWHQRTLDFFNARISQVQKIEDKKKILMLRSFFLRLSVSEIYRLAQLNSIQSLEAEESPSLADLLAQPWDHRILTLGSKSGRFKKNTHQTHSEEADNIVQVFSDWMNSMGFSDPHVGRIIVIEAVGLYQFLSSLEEFGQIYEIVFHNRIPPFFNSRAVYLNKMQQKKIDQLFFFSEQNKAAKGSAWALNQLKSGELTELELNELQAISQSSQVFEQSTVLQGDLGGWAGNFLGVFAKSPEQSVCHEKAMTVELYLRTLDGRGLLRHFKPAGSVVRLLHEAALLQSVRTQRYFVIDTWMDDGGFPARIYTESGWRKRGKEYFVPSRGE